MTLNAAQISLAAGEFRVHLALAKLSEAEAAHDLGWSLDRLHDTLTLAHGANPIDAWELRDYLHQAVRDIGGTPDFTVLTSRSRLRARLWFPLRRAPRRSGSLPGHQ